MQQACSKYFEPYYHVICCALEEHLNRSVVGTHLNLLKLHCYVYLKLHCYNTLGWVTLGQSLFLSPTLNLTHLSRLLRVERGKGEPFQSSHLQLIGGKGGYKCNWSIHVGNKESRGTLNIVCVLKELAKPTESVLNLNSLQLSNTQHYLRLPLPCPNVVPTEQLCPW